MKSSINVRYSVYAPKAERNRATHLNRATWTVYPLGSKFKLPRGASLLEQMRLLGHANIKQRSSEKCLNSAKNTNDSLKFKAKQEKHCVQRDSQKAFQSTPPLFSMDLL